MRGLGVDNFYLFLLYENSSLVARNSFSYKFSLIGGRDGDDSDGQILTEDWEVAFASLLVVVSLRPPISFPDKENFLLKNVAIAGYVKTAEYIRHLSLSASAISVSGAEPPFVGRNDSRGERRCGTM